ncbi:MAG: hypothetical protein HW416_3901, partial [Chloroflexi bacterium]|nr:hypothetical protein [Chloroflexota bacterium]
PGYGTSVYVDRSRLTERPGDFESRCVSR